MRGVYDLSSIQLKVRMRGRVCVEGQLVLTSIGVRQRVSMLGRHKLGHFVGAVQRNVKDTEVAVKIGPFRLRSVLSVEARR